MNVNKVLAWVLIVLLGGIVWTWWLGRGRLAPLNQIGDLNPIFEDSGVIHSSQPALRTFKRVVSWIGTVESQEIVDLKTLVSGRIVAIEVQDQSRVDQGKTIFRIGGPQVEGQRVILKSEWESMEARLEFARQTIERLKQSFQAHVVTEDQVAEGQDHYFELLDLFQEAKMNMEISENKTVILAPVNGVFTSRTVSPGQDVSIDQIIGQVLNVNHLRIVATLFSRNEIEFLGREATIMMDESRALVGTVVRVLPLATETGAIQVWIEAPQMDQETRPGQNILGTILLEDNSEILTVPATAIVYDSDERPFVFIQKGSDFLPCLVQTGREQDGWVEVSGVEQGQTVVTEGAFELFHRKFNEEFKVQD